MQTSFRKELEELLNKWSMENGSNTPDWILAGYVESCIESFDSGVNFRQQWHEAQAVSLPVRVVEQRDAPVHSEQNGAWLCPDCGEEWPEHHWWCSGDYPHPPHSNRSEGV